MVTRCIRCSTSHSNDRRWKLFMERYNYWRCQYICVRKCERYYCMWLWSSKNIYFLWFRFYGVSLFNDFRRKILFQIVNVRISIEIYVVSKNVLLSIKWKESSDLRKVIVLVKLLFQPFKLHQVLVHHFHLYLVRN